MTRVRIRPATPADAPAMAALLAPHIRAGGRTAIPEPPSPATLSAWWLTGPRALFCQLAEDGGGLLGLQSVSRHPQLPTGWGDVATFVREGRARRGTGRRLFAAMRGLVAARALPGLVAVVGAENGPALAYYGAMGFRLWRRLGDGRLALRRRLGP